MTLQPGTTLGNYEIMRLLGEGGMGQVFRARDTRLGREVAIKVLPPHFQDEDRRLKRFEREARLLASLNHPYIAHIYGLESFDDLNFLVMELAEGPTLKDELARGLMDRDRVYEIFEQIAQALEAAHEQGIIHRDLKPANVVLTRDHGVKVLDFGLAKALEPSGFRNDPSEAETLEADPVSVTREGQILGTPSYMSPEQAKGAPVDKRTDIWAFGTCLYEALSGVKPFRAGTTTDLLASIMRDDPDWSGLPDDLPWRVRDLLEHCLEKEPRLRLRDIGDAWAALRKVQEESRPLRATSVHDTAPRKSGRQVTAALAILGLCAILFALAQFVPRGGGEREAPPQAESRSARTSPPSRHHYLALDARHPWAEWDGFPLAISPQGDRIVYTTFPRGMGERMLYLQPLREREGKLLEGTEDGINPFFSPDGRWVAFVARGKLMKLNLEAMSRPVALADASLCYWGGHWGEDDFIYYVPLASGGVYRVRADGGEPEQLTTPDLAAGERGHWTPHLLPGGKTLLMSIPNFVEVGNRIHAYSLESKTMTPLVEGTRPVFLESGFLVFSVDDTLRAVRFDPETLEIQGSPTPVLSGLQNVSSGVAAKFDCSRGGALAYVADPNPEGRVHWVDRSGARTPVEIASNRAMDGLPTLSPDGQMLAAFGFLSPGNLESWIADLKRGTVSRASFEGTVVSPVWSPASDVLYYALIDKLQIRSYSVGKGEPGSYQLQLATLGAPYSVSPDGKTLALGQFFPFGTNWNIYLHDLEGGKGPEPLVSTPALESLAAFSPDGRWIAYNSDETGRFEIYVLPFRREGRKIQISSGGGNSPVWGPDGQELFYRSGSRLVVADLSNESGLEVTSTRELFELQFESGSAFGANYGVSPDGERFMIPVSDDEPMGHYRIGIIENWSSDLKKAVSEESG